MATETETAVYIYGIVPADVETDPDAQGIGDPPAQVRTVRCDGIAALVSEIPRDQPLGRPEDLTAHAALLDAAAAETPVLPLRFGAVVTTEEAVEEELLRAHQDDFTAALNELEGRAEYVVKARYVEETVLREILDENESLAQLRETIRGKPEDATRNERMALGEQINNAIAAKREADTQRVADALAPLEVQIAPRQPTHEEDAVHLACLAETAKHDDLEGAVGKLAKEWEGRATVRLLGPLAAYDFVLTEQPGE
ncbi:GvpL/GvpF family gas vesicle protein [Amycolatopsis sp. K13G38]|uniref:GvpL/GvpF family gas vesicle protein n=1 Tax=Amycolatopsis acididurans TaxID=2724524 RepID=A0ABX1J3G2_9PSEU|nr:GvpL/GvpF family gas vesicle protein [Amycolatopsis acididurans]NKQ52837.1 GvpL/GvpF family gas vesicle protein [Amycolatopsis acididurans]